MNEITVEQLKQKIDNNEEFTLLDVRESFEAHIAPACKYLWKS